MLIQGEIFFGSMRPQSFSKACLFENSEYDLNLNYLCYLKMVLKKMLYPSCVSEIQVKKTKNMTILFIKTFMILGYPNHSNAAADSVDCERYTVIHRPLRPKTCHIVMNQCLYAPTSCIMTHR